MEEVASNKPGKHQLEPDDEISESNSKRMKMDCLLQDENNISVTDKSLPESPVHDHDAEMPSSDNQLSTETKSNVQDDVDVTSAPLLDPLSYTKAEEFTSEIFKIQIYNLPKFGFNDLKKRLKSTLNLNPHKIKHINKIFVTYVCFKNEADRDEALKKINGHVWKGKTLEAKIAKPAADPYLQKQLQEKGSKLFTEKSSKSNSTQETLQPTAEEAETRLRANVIPLWDVDYTDQLQMKTKLIRNILARVTKHHFVKHMFEDRSKHDGLACELLPIVPSPITTEYRNKNEFSIGFGLDGKTKMVGFRYGLYKDGTTAVGSCENLGIAMPAAIPVVKSFIDFITESQWEPFLQQSGTGHWQTLTVRTQRTGDVMAMVDFSPRKLDQSEIDAAKNSLKEFFTTGAGKDVYIKSLYFRILSGKGQNTRNNLELLLGEPHVYESLLEMKFRISPQAFFQVNTPATEKLYELIAEWCNASSSTTVLDICCGTGTIGLSMAKKVKSVIGIEMCSEAVEDAKANASLNDICNATFHCAKVEDIISKVMLSLQSSNDGQDIVAVVDPPRAGLHKDVIKSLRKCQAIRHLVYVSCNPESALDNFIDIIRPETGRHKGSPYKMVKATPVDLFPGTKHCELLILFAKADASNDVPMTDANTDVNMADGAESSK
ncbi:unnamed protein product [Lymnaea stagnalis]|uniref:tRNA (uracil(54)-C(5))-methyltransferase n=1 Tax=Lymnaea stagnalis TaxID=6523 RepID=A0AAV2I0M2_LYMST